MKSAQEKDARFQAYFCRRRFRFRRCTFSYGKLLGMTSDEYKGICQQPNILGRFYIEEATRLLPVAESNLKARLLAILSQEPVPKPLLHTGQKFTDYFRVNLTEQEATRIVNMFLSFKAETLTPDGETTPDALILAYLVEEWTRYKEFKSD